MKKIINSAILTLVVFGNAFSQSLPKKPEDLHLALVTAWNTGDVNKILALYEDNGILIPKPGQSVSGKEKLKEALAWFFKHYRNF